MVTSVRRTKAAINFDWTLSERGKNITAPSEPAYVTNVSWLDLERKDGTIGRATDTPLPVYNFDRLRTGDHDIW